MNDEQNKALNEFEAARKRVHGQPTVSQGAIRSETQYAEAYQELVRLGLAPQIKAKHRFTEVAHQRRAGN
jgi:hypothetical protein